MDLGTTTKRDSKPTKSQIPWNSHFTSSRLRKYIFYLNCEVSDISPGAELYQENDQGEHLIISFVSRVLNNCEQKNY